MRNRVTDYLADGSILSGIMTLGRGLITSFFGRRLNAQWHVDARVTRQQRRSGRKLITWQTSGMLTLASLGSNLGGSAIATLGGSALLRVASRGSLSDSTVLASFGDLRPEAHLYCNIDLGLCAAIGFGSCSNIGLGIAIG